MFVPGIRPNGREKIGIVLKNAVIPYPSRQPGVRLNGRGNDIIVEKCNKPYKTACYML